MNLESRFCRYVHADFEWFLDDRPCLAHKLAVHALTGVWARLPVPAGLFDDQRNPHYDHVYATELFSVKRLEGKYGETRLETGPPMQQPWRDPVGHCLNRHSLLLSGWRAALAGTQAGGGRREGRIGSFRALHTGNSRDETGDRGAGGGGHGWCKYMDDAGAWTGAWTALAWVH
ncbi:unnamed protein product [Symbiodinium microadriaticum]|nr:unnamed protein product [Symbiodinium microadriaticum]